MLAEFTVLKQVSSCGSVSCLINTEPLEMLRLQPSEPIASESVAQSRKKRKHEDLGNQFIDQTLALNLVKRKCLISKISDGDI